MIKFILVGGYPYKATDGGKAFAHQLVAGFTEEVVNILLCMFARPRDNWEKAYAQDIEFFTAHLYPKKVQFQLANPETFKAQVQWSQVVYIRGGSTEVLLSELQKQNIHLETELHGKTLAGSSAGAQAISRYYYGVDSLQVGEGLGLLPVKVVVHYQSDYNAPNINWERAVSELKDYKEDLPVITLAEGQFHTEYI